jgi:hypothetical protein
MLELARLTVTEATAGGALGAVLPLPPPHAVRSAVARARLAVRHVVVRRDSERRTTGPPSI